MTEHEVDIFVEAKNNNFFKCHTNIHQKLSINYFKGKFFYVYSVYKGNGRQNN
jgi:hypothetical protein